MTTNVETRPGEGGVSKLVVKGKDLSALMDIIELNGVPYPAMPPAVRVLIVLAKYAALGVIPMVIPSIVEDVPIPLERIPHQSGTDYAYVKKLAQQCGYVFYLEPGPVPGTSKAYWGPEIRVGEPQPALTREHGRQEQRRRAELQLREGKEDDADRVLPGAEQQGGHRPSDSRRHAAESAAWCGAAAAAEDQRLSTTPRTCRRCRR